ncbi:organic solute transporter subunit alpha/Transmembrane protein, partial [Dendryphion nanum]
LTFHHLGLIISAVFGAAAVVIAFFLIWRHASHYLKAAEQKYIIRILVMIPIYAVVSFLSYVYYKHAIYYEVLRDCYEAFAIASFFTLMCHYIAPNLHEQKQYFRNIEPKNWVWPVNWMQKCTGGETKGIFRKPQSGLTWFNIVWISVFQYCFVRPFFTVVAVATQANHLYCQSSKDPRYAYIWVAGFEAISVTIAMYCLIQFYVQLKHDLAPYRPFLKVLCIKLVIFFCFWQSWIISLLATPNGPLKATAKIAGPDWRVGLPSMLVCFEMAIFAVLHLFAFPWKPYDLGKRQDTINGFPNEEPKNYVSGPLRAIVSAFNPWDIIKAFGRGMRWLFIGVRHRKNDISY